MHSKVMNLKMRKKYAKWRKVCKINEKNVESIEKNP